MAGSSKLESRIEILQLAKPTDATFPRLHPLDRSSVARARSSPPTRLFLRDASSMCVSPTGRAAGGTASRQTGAWLGMAAHIRADPALAPLRHPGESSSLRFSLLTTWRTHNLDQHVEVQSLSGLYPSSARKLEEHRRKYERKHAEKELKEKVERARRAREEHARAAKESSEDLGGESGDPGDFYKTLFSDPELMQAFQDPEVAAAFQDITSNPANMAKYQGNPKIKAVINKLAAKFGGAGGMPGGFGGMPGGFGGMGGGFPGYPPTGGSNSTPGSDDVGLD
uniref:STI1 domain-containing protein n=1 Tax=Timema bartmani TaxID=61472 RepID=A0A7R9F3I8_9NEOP|nr:unnamed protein product [Timema bartmani]